MAIDPSISLNIKPAEPLDLTRLQQLRNLVMQEQATAQQISASQAQEALARAQLPGVALQQELTAAQIPGVRAESEIRARASAFNKWLENNSRGYMDATTGNVDRRRLALAAEKEGFATEADSIMASHLKNLIDQANIATNEQQRGIALSNYTNDLISATANTISNLKDPAARTAILARNSEFAEKLMPGSGKQLLSVLGMPDEKTAGYMPDMPKVDAILKSTMTPLQAANLSIAQRQIAVSEETLRQAGITSISGPEARDPNSRMSVALRNLATNLGIPGVTPNMPAAEIANLPGFKQAVPAGIIPGEAKVGAIAGSQREAQNAIRLDNTAALVDKLKNRGLLTGTTKVGTWIANQVSKLGNDPDYRALVAELEEIQRNNPAVDTNVGADALGAQLRGLSKTAKDVSKEAGKVAGAVTFPQVAPQQQGRGAQTPTGKTVQLIDRTGRLYNVPEELADSYLKNPDMKSMGLKRVQSK